MENFTKKAENIEDMQNSMPKENLTEKDFEQFKDLEKDVKKVLNFAKKDEKQKSTYTSIAELDMKFAKKLEEKGHVDLAKSIIKKAPKHNTAAVQKPKNKRLIWFSMSFATLSLLFAGFIVVGFYAGWLDFLFAKPTVGTLTQLADEKPLPLITLRPENVSSNGYVEQSNKFTIKVEGAIDGDAVSQLDIEPKIDAKITSQKVDGNTEILVEPTNVLDRGTDYQISLKEGTKFDNGSELKRDLTWALTIEPYFAVLGTTPNDGADNVPLNTAIEFEFNHKNIDAAKISQYVSFSPNIKGRFEIQGMKIVFLPDSLSPNTKYTVKLAKDYSDENGEALTEESVFGFTTSNESVQTSGKAYFNWRYPYSSQAVVNNNETVNSEVEGYNITGNVDFTLYEISEQSLINSIRSNHGIFTSVPDGAISITTDSKPIGMNNIAQFSYKPQNYGIYLLEARNASTDNSIYRVVVYSPIGIVAQVSDVSSTVWGFDMGTSKVAEGITVTGYKFDSDTVVGNGNTDTSGYVSFAKSDYIIAKRGQNEYAVNVLGDSSSTFATPVLFMRMFWVDSDYSIYFYTDKPLYSAGDTVRFKGIVRKFNADGIANPEGKSVTLRVGDFYGYIFDGHTTNIQKTIPLFEKEYATDQYGTFNGSFTIPQSEKENSKQITMSIDGKIVASDYLNIAKYNKPLYEYSAVTEKVQYSVGESVKFTIIGTDYSGNPASGKLVSVNLGYSTAYPHAEGKTYSAESVYGSKNADERTVTLDANGKYEYLYTPLVRAEEGPVVGYTLSVASKDNEFSTSGGTSILVAQTSNDVVVEPVQNTYAEGETGEFNLTARRLWDYTPAGNVNAVVKVERYWTETVQYGMEYDPTTKTSVPKYSSVSKNETVFANMPVEFSQDGTAKVQVQNLKDGSYNITGTMGGTTIIGSSFYVFGNQSGISGRVRGLNIRLTNSEVSSGETTKAMIYSATEGDMISYVDTGKLLSWNKMGVGANGGTSSYDITSSDDMYPNANVCVFKVVSQAAAWGNATTSINLGKVFALDCVTLSVSSKTGTLNIKLTPDKTDYNPGDTVSMSVDTTDANGNPISAQVGAFSVDKGLIDLVPYNEYSNDPRNQFYFSKANRSHLLISNILPDLFGGAGGAGDGSVVRSDFSDTALWNPNIVTDNNGHAVVQFKLPDNLMTWNIYAFGSDQSKQFGLANTQIKTKLSRFSNIELPRFVRNGDKIVPYVEIANYAEAFVGKVKVSCVGCVNATWESGDISVDVNTRKRINPELVVSSNAKSVVIRVDLINTQASSVETQYLDSVEKKIPVYNVGQVTNDVNSTILKDATDLVSVKVDMGPSYRADINQVELTVSKMFSLDQFDYPVDPSTKSSIQLSYGILQNAFIYKYYDALKPEISKEDLFARIKIAYEKLIANQSSNGGFSWFGYDAVSMEASSLAAEAVASAKSAGVNVNPFVLSELTRYFSDIYKDDKYSVYDKATALMSISYYDPAAVITDIYAFRDQITSDESLSKSPYLLTSLMLTFNNMGSFGDSSELVAYMRKVVKESDRGAYWEDTETNYKLMGSSDYITSVVYLSLAPLEHWDLKSKTRNWMMDRKSVSYYSDQMYQRIVYSLAVADSQSVFDKGKASDLAVVVNGKDAGKISISKDESSAKVTLIVPSDLLTSGENTVEVKRTSGAGDLYILASSDKVSDAVVAGAGSTGTENFTITKTYLDLKTGAALNPANIPADSMVKVHLEVTANIDADNVLVRDQHAAGIVPKVLGLNDVTLGDYQSYYNSNGLENINKWGGNVATDFVTFTESSMKKGKVYKYEYLSQAKFAGEYDGGLVTASVEMFPDVRGVKVSEGVVVK